MKTISFDVAALAAFTAACVRAKVVYRWGGKIPHHGVPGKDFTGADCSGFVDEAIFLATDGAVDLPAGSWYQEEYVQKQGFERSTYEAAKRADGVVYLAFLPQLDGHARHVVLIVDGVVHQSSSTKGVNTCAWGSQGWMAKCAVYVLSRPLAAAPEKPKPQPIMALVKGIKVPAFLLLEDPAPTSVIAARPLADAGLLTLHTLDLKAGKATISAPGIRLVKKEVRLELIDQKGYVPARDLEAYLGTLGWDNARKLVTIE